jgi:hypothetical protein
VSWRLPLLLVCLPAILGFPGLLDDGASHPPPTTGGFAYNTFVPASPIGTTYVEPVFGPTVQRVTTDGAEDDSYARNMWWNADETRYFHRGKIINLVSNTVEYTGIPGATGSFNFDMGFDPVDPNVLYYFLGASIHKVTLQAGGTWADTIYFTTPGSVALQSLGGTLNWIDPSGRYMLVRYGAEPSVYVYDRNNLGLGPYANPVTGSATVGSNGYVGLSPDGQYLVGYEDSVNAIGGPALSGSQGVSWRITHANRTVDQAPNIFWSLCGDHGSFLSASDGRNYMVAFNCYDVNSIWRVDITNNAANLTFAQQKALPNNLQLLGPLDWSVTGHITAIAKGTFRDWAFYAVEDTNDVFNGGVSPWFLYRSEIVAMNVVTGEVRRLAHHRSRSIGNNYYYSPRVSASWTGKWVGWASNFNQSGVADIYAVALGGSVPPPPTPSLGIGSGKSLTLGSTNSMSIGAAQ